MRLIGADLHRRRVGSASMKVVNLPRGRRSWRVTLVLVCGHEVVVDYAWKPRRMHYSNGRLKKRDAERLLRVEEAPCPACGPRPPADPALTRTTPSGEPPEG